MQRSTRRKTGTQSTVSMIPVSAGSLLNWSCVVLACGLGGAFLPPPVARGPVTRSRHHIPSTIGPSRYDARPSPRVTGKTVYRMHAGGDDELQLAVKTLASQVEDLTAMVKQLADDTAPAAGVDAGAPQSQSINGAAVGNQAAVPVSEASSTTGKKKSSAPTELVSTANAQYRIDQWLKEQGLPVSTPEAPPATQPADTVSAASSAAVVPAEVPAPPVVAPPAEESPAGDSAGTGYKVKIEWEGAIHEVTCDAETTVLDAAMDAGLDLPHSCMSGSCLTCPGKLVSGKVDQSEGVLEDDQTEAGYMLTCISYPLSDLHFNVIEEDDLP